MPQNIQDSKNLNFQILHSQPYDTQHYTPQHLDITELTSQALNSNHYPPNHALQVSELTAQIKSALESDFIYVRVEGEVSGYTQHSSGHIYFTLKDERASISCILFRSKAMKIRIRLKNGDKIIVSGSISVYMQRGTYSINVEKCEYSGVGDLRLHFERLKKELECKGYFDKKKVLQKFPKKIILLTSKSGAALQDMIKVAKSRFCVCEFLLIDTLTQGKEAKFSIAKNLAIADSLRADIIILARGGGSIEDLWSFNEIEVLEAIFHAKTLVVSAIGHEIDYLLSDYVADVRAPTPSAAMQMILQDKDALRMQLIEIENMLTSSFYALMDKKRDTLAFLSKSVELLHPAKKILTLRQNMRVNENLLRDSIKIFISRKKQELGGLYSHLKSLKPSVLDLRAKIENLRLMLNLSMQGIFKTQRQNLSRLDSTLDITHFIEKKRVALTSLSQILNNINPQHSLKKGYVQMLKNDKPIEVKELESGDEIELVDATSSAKAMVI